MRGPCWLRFVRFGAEKMFMFTYENSMILGGHTFYPNIRTEGELAENAQIFVKHHRTQVFQPKEKISASGPTDWIQGYIRTSIIDVGRGGGPTPHHRYLPCS